MHPTCWVSLRSTSGYGLSDPCQFARVALPAPDIDIRGVGDGLHRLGIERAHRARGTPHDERIVREHLVLGHQSAGTDQTVLSDLRAIENDGTHADEAVASDAAAMQHHVMADDAIVADREGKPGISMKRGIVLDLRALAELDPFVVATQNRAEPHAGIALQAHAPDHGCALGNPVAAGGGKVRSQPIQRENCHLRPPVLWRNTLDSARYSCRPDSRWARHASIALGDCRPQLLSSPGSSKSSARIGSSKYAKRPSSSSKNKTPMYSSPT